MPKDAMLKVRDSLNVQLRRASYTCLCVTLVLNSMLDSMIMYLPLCARLYI